MSWTAAIDVKKVFIETDEVNKNGKPKLRPIYLKSVTLTNGIHAIKFSCGKRTFSDTREAFYGTGGTTGLWGTREPAKCGYKKSLTPVAWREEVKRFIGEERANSIIKELFGENS